MGIGGNGEDHPFGNGADRTAIRYRLNGNRLEFPVETTLLDLTGKTLFRGLGSCPLPPPGLYLLRQGTRTAKITL